MRDFWEYASFVVTALALPVAIAFFMWEQRKERDNEEEEGYQLLSDAYNDFLKIMLISLFERAYLVAWKPRMTATESRRWNSWDDYMREWCRRDNFHASLPLLLRGEDPEFQAYIRRISEEERGPIIQTA